MIEVSSAARWRVTRVRSLVVATAIALAAPATVACSARPSACPDGSGTVTFTPAASAGPARDYAVSEASASVRDRVGELEITAHPSTASSSGSSLAAPTAGELRIAFTIEDSNGALSPGTYYQAATNKYERRLVVRQAVTLDGSDVARSADSTIAQRVEVLAVDDAALCARIDAGGLSGTVRLPRT